MWNLHIDKICKNLIYEFSYSMASTRRVSIKQLKFSIKIMKSTAYGKLQRNLVEIIKHFIQYLKTKALSSLDKAFGKRHTCYKNL